MMRFPGKLALQQRVLPVYRAPFFDLLASACEQGMSLFTGLPRPAEGITVAKQLQIANYQFMLRSPSCFARDGSECRLSRCFTTK